MEAQVSSWSLPALSAAFPSSLFKVSKPHGGRALMMLPAYVDYMARQADEEPLYVFDATFAEAAPGIRKLYDVPHVFTITTPSWGPPAQTSGRIRWALYPPLTWPPPWSASGRW
ncbi:hypothetical protein Vafri_15582 [Volvox africanus]|uniref:Uncharacterized protein n=1 Tax=Volvox africanus TaxID=51714 RepID=A0A8J4BGS4_9CHLO|nr:hypothetical protein Vafri_15582 [Volvox africanus]